MSSDNPNLSTLSGNIKKGIDNRLKELHTSLPGIIESFDAAKQTATIQPAIKRIFVKRDGVEKVLSSEALPVLINVPVQFPRGGGFSITFPVKKGDECLIVFTERSLDRWHSYGGVKDPGGRRFHDLSDGTAFVGLSSTPNKVPDYNPDSCQIKKDDGTALVSLNPDSSINITATSNVVADCADMVATCSGSAQLTAGSSVTVEAPDITLTGNVTITGEVSITGGLSNNGKDVGDTHKHSQKPDLGGDKQEDIDGVL